MQVVFQCKVACSWRQNVTMEAPGHYLVGVPELDGASFVYVCVLYFKRNVCFVTLNALNQEALWSDIIQSKS